MGRQDYSEKPYFIALLVLRLVALIAVGFVLRFLGDLL